MRARVVGEEQSPKRVEGERDRERERETPAFATSTVFDKSPVKPTNL